jgi:predicted SAM-dependent methyltransferase
MMPTILLPTVQQLFSLGMKREVNDLVFMPDGIQLNLGSGNHVIAGATSLDYPEWDADTMDIPFTADTVSGIHCYHFLEHCKEPVRVLQEMQRVLIPGGVVNIVVPYYTSQMMAHDLDHKHAFCEETWRNLFKNKFYDKNKIEWKFKINFNMIIGVVERNLCLMTQLIKEA